MLKSVHKGDQPGYNGATFLYIRAYDGDAGARPIPPDTVFWLSPDIELFDSGGVRISTTEIKIGSAYNVEVIVTNDGDKDCYSCHVELFLDNPSIGFNTAASKPLGSEVVEVGRFSKTAVHFPFTATSDMAGHRCMFARISSFVTNDKPDDLIGFNAYLDRHLGQQNLDLVQQGNTFDFNVHLGAAFQGKDLNLTLKPNAKVAGMLRMAAFGRYLVVNRTAVPPAITIARMEMPLQREEMNRWAFRSKLEREALRMDIPQLGLRNNQALPMDLRVSDPATGHVVGGIVLLVVG